MIVFKAEAVQRKGNLAQVRRVFYPWQIRRYIVDIVYQETCPVGTCELAYGSDLNKGVDKNRYLIKIEEIAVLYSSHGSFSRVGPLHGDDHKMHRRLLAVYIARSRERGPQLSRR